VCVKAAVSKTLPVPVLLGTDVPELSQLLGESIAQPQVKECMIVVTRAHAFQQLHGDTITRSKEQQSGIQPHVILTEPKELTNIGGEFDNEIF